MLLYPTVDQTEALAIVQESSLPFASVPVSATCVPTVLRWHSRQPTVDEVARHDVYKAQQDKETRQLIAREIRDLRAQRLRAAGLRAG